MKYDRKEVFLIISIIAIASVVITGLFIQPYLYNRPIKTINGISKEESLKMALDYVRSSPTFKFDGIEESLNHVETLTLRCPYCWQFVFIFKSRHSGYGERIGQMLAQVITIHNVKIMVKEGKIINAEMDGVWDMINQSML